MITFGGIKDDLAEIDKEIARLEDRLFRLRTRRNAMVPINQIPREVLQEIMYYVRGEDEMADEEEFCLEKLDQVCRHWRDVALNYPVLWAKICLCLPTGFSVMWLNELLKRSRSSPLSIKFYPKTMDPYEYDPVTTMIIWEQRHRIRVLDVDETENDGEPTYFVQLLMSQPLQWPLLESLSLRMPSNDPVRTRSMVLPKLRSLTIESYWNSNLMAPTLQHLCIRAIVPGLTLSKISRILSVLPNLQTLELVDSLQDVEDIDWETYTFGQGPVQLPDLHTLTLHSKDCNTAAMFLSCITLHDGVSLHLHPEKQRDNSFFEKVVRKAFQMKPPSACLASPYSLRLSGYSDVTFTLSTAHDDLVFFEISVPEMDDEVFFMMISNLPLQNLTSCSILIPYLIEYGERRIRSLSKARNLEVITVNSFQTGFVKFFDNMAKCIPQCNVHQQTSHERADLDGTCHPSHNDFYPCDECQELGKSFFPALRRIVLQLSTDRDITERSLPLPSLDFFDRRIRCGLHIEEVFIDEEIRPRKLESFRRKFTDYDLGPSIAARSIMADESSDGESTWSESDDE